MSTLTRYCHIAKHKNVAITVSKIRIIFYLRKYGRKKKIFCAFFVKPDQLISQDIWHDKRKTISLPAY